MPSEPACPVAFIAGEFPKASETFILRDLRALRERGMNFVVVTTRRLPDVPEAAGIDAEIIERPGMFAPKTILADARMRLTHPLRCIEILCTLYAAHWRSLRELASMSVNLPRALAVGYMLKKRGVRRVHALWAGFPATFGWIIARAFGMTFSFSAHSRDVYVDGRMLKAKMKLASAVAVCNEAAAGELRRVVGERLARKIVIARHGIEPEALPTRADAPGRTILAAGRLVPKKGFDVLIRACARLEAEGHSPECMVVGDGPERARLERLAAKLGVRGVRLAPWMPHDALMAELARAACVAVPSVVAPGGDRDGIPNLILEAMAIGTPVVAADTGGIGEVVRDGETGWLVPAGDPARLAAALAPFAVQDDAKRCKKVQNGAKKVHGGAKTVHESDIMMRACELIRQDATLSRTIVTLERLLRD